MIPKTFEKNPENTGERNQERVLIYWSDLVLFWLCIASEEQHTDVLLVQFENKNVEKHWCT